MAHQVAHPGIEKTYAYLQERFYWAGMKKGVEECCKECMVCLENKRAVKRKEPLKPIVGDVLEPRRMKAADIAILTWSADGYHYILIIVDLFSKFVELTAMREQTAESVRRAIETGWLYRYGVPDVLLTDQGRNVDWEEVRSMCAKFGIEKRHSSAYHPQGDGQVERTVENAKQTLRCVLAAREVDKTIWPHILQEVAYGLNSLKSSSTKFMPQELMFGSRIRSPIDQIVGVGGSVSRGNPRIEEHKEWIRAAENMERARAQTKRQYDKSSLGGATTIGVGQTALLRNFNRADGLDPMFTGQYTVVDIKYPNVKVQKGENRYTWVDLNDCKIVQQPAPVNLWAQNEPKQAGERVEDESNIEEPIMISIDTEVEGQEDRAGSTPPGNSKLRRSSRTRKQPDRYGTPAYS